MVLKLLERAKSAFGDVARPEHFTDYKHCCECAEHDSTFQAHTPDSIGLKELGNPGWDPICFATDEAFKYFFPASDREPRQMLYMVIEHFKNRDPVPAYRRFRDQGRLIPQGVRYVSSWVDEEMHRCFQLMETDERTLLDQWMENWSDLVDFEVYPVKPSSEAAQIIAPRL